MKVSPDEWGKAPPPDLIRKITIVQTQSQNNGCTPLSGIDGSTKIDLLPTAVAS